jgi:hypothetical protein
MEGLGMKMAKAAKRLTKKEARQLGEPGAFALHLAAILSRKQWTHQDLAKACQAASLNVKEHQVRAWLRGENMPKSSMLRPIGRVLGLADPRHILPD